MKNLKHIVLLFFSFVVLASCGSSKPATAENKTTITLRETVHDTLFKIEKDSSSYLALLECQNGKVAIKNVIQAEPGRTLKSPKVRLDNNQLKIDCEAIAQELLAHYKDTYQASNTVVSVPFEVNKITWWQHTQIILFRIYAILTLLFAIWLYLKSKI
jgi:hypothetical protein